MNTNIELNKVGLWFQSNKLTLNVSKTKFILFRTNRMNVDFSNVSLRIGDEIIERIGNDCKTKSFKFVGIHLDEFITWEKFNFVFSK